MHNYQKAIMSVLSLLMFLSGSVSFHRGMCVRVTHCLAGFESLFSPSGGSQGEMTLLRVRKWEERGKDYPDEDVVGGDEERQQARRQTVARKTIIINDKTD